MSPDAATLPEGVADALPPEDPQAAVNRSTVADASSAPPWRIRMGPHAVPPSWGPPPAYLRGSATSGRRVSGRGGTGAGAVGRGRPGAQCPGSGLFRR